VRVVFLGLIAAAVVASASAAGTKPPIPAAKAREYARSVNDQLAKERRAIQLIGTDKLSDAKTAMALLETSGDLLTATGFALQHDYDLGGPSPVPDLDAGETADVAAREALREGTRAGDTKALSEIAKGIAAKKRAISKLDDLASRATVPRCEVTKPFSVYAIPAGYASSTNDVFPHDIPKGAKNIEVSFVDEATGKAPAPELFPGETWSMEVKGFQPDGKFDVRVSVSGTGFGKPDANSKKWKVVVSFDCP